MGEGIRGKGKADFRNGIKWSSAGKGKADFVRSRAFQNRGWKEGRVVAAVLRTAPTHLRLQLRIYRANQKEIESNRGNQCPGTGSQKIGRQKRQICTL